MSNSYRDDRLAAHALADTLQRENAELRAELARVREESATFAPPPTAPHPPGSQRAFTGLLTVTLLGVASVGVVAAMRPTHITVVTAAPEAIGEARPQSQPAIVHTPASGRFVQRPPTPSTRFPSQSDVFMAVQSARPAVERCFHDRSEHTLAMIEFASDGSVSDVKLEPESQHNECIATALRTMRLPPFAASVFTTEQTFSAQWARR